MLFPTLQVILLSVLLASKWRRNANRTRLPATTYRSSNVCFVDSGSFPNFASDIASRLSIPLLSAEEIESTADSMNNCTHYLSIVPYEIGLLKDFALGISAKKKDDNSSFRHKKKHKVYQSGLHVVDFFPPLSSILGKRGAGDSGPDLLLRAVAPRRGFKDGAIIFDLTAGFGQDALLMAKAGANKVVMVERDPILAMLLYDALRRLELIARLSNDPTQQKTATSLSETLCIIQGDGRQVIEDLTKSFGRPDIIYLDPMFPVRTKKALVKQNMQILHGLLQSQVAIADQGKDDDEAALLFDAAYRYALSRVVVKRPVNAPPLCPVEVKKPSFDIRGSVNRWDVYSQ